MTFRQFWVDPYQTTQRTGIGTVSGSQVTLASTIFFALSGGQDSDQGTIGESPVLEVRKDGSEIVYTLPDQHGLVSGQEVEVVIDWPRRCRLMRLHFAAEIGPIRLKRNNIGKDKERVEIYLTS